MSFPCTISSCKHYPQIDTILIAYSNEKELQRFYEDVVISLSAAGSQLATEKFQMLSPYEYVDNVLELTTVQPQKIFF